MTTRRKHLGCAVYNSYICKSQTDRFTRFELRLDAVGGRDDATELSTAERYNPKTNQWSPVVAMNSRRSGVRLSLLLCVTLPPTLLQVGLAVVNNNLMAIGGFDVRELKNIF